MLVQEGKSEVEEAAPRVLVVDDEDAIRMLVHRVLQRSGYELVDASDGREAIDRLDVEQFDAVVLDLMMPRVDGFGVVEHLINTQPRMVEKIVVMTAFPRAAAKERLHQICCVLSKPFEISELLAAVKECTLK
jgi:CheY-like chemotaxis protein